MHNLKRSLALVAATAVIMLMGAASAGADPVSDSIGWSGATPMPATIPDTVGFQGVVLGSAVTVSAPSGDYWLACSYTYTNAAGATVPYGPPQQNQVSFTFNVGESGAGIYTVTCSAYPPGEPDAPVDTQTQSYDVVPVSAPTAIPSGYVAASGGPESDQITFAGLDGGWSGYVEPASAGSGFTGATGTFTVANVNEPSAGANASAAANATWVGLDGYNRDYHLLQAGVMLRPGQQPEAWYVDQSAATATRAAYEPVPLSLSVAVGDKVTVTISQTKW